MPPFKKLQLIIALLLVCNTALFAQTDQPTTPTKIPDMLQNADYVFEGTVIDAKGYWAKDERGLNTIYTSMLVQVTNIFKGYGMKLGLVQLIVRGGEAKLNEQETLIAPYYSYDNRNAKPIFVRGGNTGLISANKTNTTGYNWKNNTLENTFMLQEIEAFSYCSYCLEKKYSAPWGEFNTAKEVRQSIKQFNLATDFIDRSDIVEDSLAQIQKNNEAKENKAIIAKQQQDSIAYTHWENKILTAKIGNADVKKNAKLNVNVNLNVDIRNYAYTSNASNQKFLEFDVYVWGNSVTYLNGLLVRFNYDKYAFGDSVYKHNAISATLGTSFNNINYKIYLAPQSDISDTVVSIPFGMNDSLTSVTRVAVSTTPLQLMHIKLLIKNCAATAKMQLTDKTLTSLVFTNYVQSATVPDTIIYTYDLVTYTEGAQPLSLCPMPKITGFSPAVIRAGTGEILTITGKGFGNVRGNGHVYFPNADYLGEYMPGCDTLDYVWSDTLIKVKIPTILLNSNYINQSNGVAGSGKFKVVNNLGYRDSTSTNLDIEYALENSPTVAKKKVYWSYNNCQNSSFVFKLGQSLQAYPQAVAIIDSAIGAWAKFLNVDIRLQKNDTLGYQYFSDNIVDHLDSASIIFREDTLSNDAVMQTSPSILACGTNYRRYASDIGIKMTGVSWYFGINDTKPSGKNDFYSDILHELGHALGLLHIINPNASSNLSHELELMYWNESPSLLKTSTQRSFIGTGRQMDKAASLYLRDSSKVINWACSNLIKIRNYSNPKSTKVCLGNTATFDAFVEQLPGSPVPVFQWQFNTGNGVWQNISALTSAPYNLTLTYDNIYTVSFIPSLAMNNFFFRCIISNVDGCSITTQSARLTVVNSPLITQQPTNASMLTGSNQTRTFTFITTGTVTYQWYKYISKFNQPMLTNTSPYSGVTTSTLSVTATSALPIGTHQYYCIATDNTTGCTKVSNLVNLYLYAPKKLASPEAIMNDAPFGCILSPNPASANLTIDLMHQKEEKTLVEIYNSMGVVVLQIDFTLTTKDIYVGNLPNGWYLIKLQNGSEQLSKEIIITH